MLSLTAPPAEATVVVLILGEEDCPMIPVPVPVPVVLAGREVHNREEVLMLDNNNNDDDDDKIDIAPTYLLLLLLFLELVPYSKALLRRTVVPNSPSEWC